MIQGYVKKVNTKEGTGKRGKWTLYSFIVEQDNGQESGWINGGFDKPPFNEGSYVSLETEVKEGRTQLIIGSAKVLDPPVKPPVVATSSAAPASTKGNYVDRNDSIVYQSSRKDAIALIALLLEHDALPMSAAATKSGQAKRFEEVTAFVDKLTVQYYGDVQTGRVLQSVVDAGAVPAATASGQTDTGAGKEIDND